MSGALRIGSLIDATEAEGPGLRFVIWTQGCSLGCPDCCNPHLWNPRGGEDWSEESLWARIEAARVRHPALEGLTLVGGEPFEQDAPLAALCARARAAGLSVMAFSGYTLAELEARGSRLLGEVDLLVDGRYEAARYTASRRWIGSTNQGLHFLSEAYAPSDPRFTEPNHAEVRLDHRGVISVVGFPFPKVRAEFGPQSDLARAQEPTRLPRATQASRATP